MKCFFQKMVKILVLLCAVSGIECLFGMEATTEASSEEVNTLAASTDRTEVDSSDETPMSDEYEIIEVPIDAPLASGEELVPEEDVAAQDVTEQDATADQSSAVATTEASPEEINTLAAPTDQTESDVATQSTDSTLADSSNATSVSDDYEVVDVPFDAPLAPGEEVVPEDDDTAAEGPTTDEGAVAADESVVASDQAEGDSEDATADSEEQASSEDDSAPVADGVVDDSSFEAVFSVEEGDFEIIGGEGESEPTEDETMLADDTEEYATEE